MLAVSDTEHFAEHFDIIPGDRVPLEIEVFFARCHYTRKKPNLYVYFKCWRIQHFSGGMQDYNYLAAGTFEITLEVSCCKYPNASELPGFWELNRDALINLLLEAHIGKYINC